MLYILKEYKRESSDGLGKNSLSKTICTFGGCMQCKLYCLRGNYPSWYLDKDLTLDDNDGFLHCIYRIQILISRRVKIFVFRRIL